MKSNSEPEKETKGEKWIIGIAVTRNLCCLLADDDCHLELNFILFFGRTRRGKKEKNYKYLYRIFMTNFLFLTFLLSLTLSHSLAFDSCTRKTHFRKLHTFYVHLLGWLSGWLVYDRSRRWWEQIKVLSSWKIFFDMKIRVSLSKFVWNLFKLRQKSFLRPVKISFVVSLNRK